MNTQGQSPIIHWVSTYMAPWVVFIVNYFIVSLKADAGSCSQNIRSFI